MVRAVARLAAVGSLITVLGVAAFSPAYADGALGLNGPTGEPLPWTLAVVVGLGGAAFLVRAVLRLRATPQTQRVGAASRVAASRAAQLVSSPDPAGSPPASNSSRASRSSADAVPAR
jgi:hypothetical protein